MKHTCRSIGINDDETQIPPNPPLAKGETYTPPLVKGGRGDFQKNKRKTIREYIENIITDNYLLAIICYNIYFNLRDLQRKEKLIVYQMGKVGSSTIYESLKRLRLFSVYQVHHLTQDSIDRVEKVITSHNSTLPQHIWESRYLHRQINGQRKKNNKGEKWKVITLVREPIARNISAFFENIYLQLPDLTYQLGTGSIKIEKLIETFLERYPHDLPLQWFDLEIKEVFGIDVFLSDFPRSKGYKIYKKDNIDLLLLRLEDINRISQEAVKEFLNIEDFKLINSNISKDKRYYTIYRNFLESIVLPLPYINKIYNSRYTKHFYSEEEIEVFKKRWSKDPYPYLHPCRGGDVEEMN